jgi:hypothetical protein
MRTFALLVLLVGLAVLAGCTTVTKSPAEVRATYSQAFDLDMRGIADDWNLIWLAERQYRFTRWYTR